MPPDNYDEKRVLSEIRSSHEEIAAFTRELISVATENPPGNFCEACVELIARQCGEVGLDYEVVRPSPRPSLLGFLGSGPRILYFHGHYDVVPAQAREQFQPRMRGDALFGRGSSDMKGGLAAIIFALRAIKRSGLEMNGRIGLMIVPDEETGGRFGSSALIEEGVLGRDGIGMLTPEPTGGVIWNASRGAITLRVTVRGKAAHVGLHHQGENAFERMLKVAGELVHLRSEIQKRETSYAIRPEAARRSVLLLGGQCQGGTNFNVVPDECSFTLDRRINPEEELAEEKARLMSLFDRLRREGIPLDVEVLQEGMSGGSSQEDPLAKELTASIKTVTGNPTRFEMCPGLLEIRFYCQLGIPAYAYGPGLLSVSHGPHEYVSLNSVSDVAAVYALTALRMLGAQRGT